jgi:hypothetical protein
VKVIDQCIDPHPELWHAALDTISSGTDALKENYKSIDFAQFLSFTCLVEDNRIIAFSGLQYDQSKWGPKFARCSSRMWIHPDHRITHLKKFTGGQAFLNSYYCVPHQIMVAKSKGLDGIFVSREHNRVGFIEYLKLLGTNTDHEFSILDHRYWVCGSVRDSSCLQHIGVHYLNDRGQSSWRDAMSCNQYLENNSQ